MTCTSRLFDGPLCCDNPAPEPHAHTYHAAWSADRHDTYDPEEQR